MSKYYLQMSKNFPSRNIMNLNRSNIVELLISPEMIKSNMNSLNFFRLFASKYNYEMYGYSKMMNT